MKTLFLLLSVTISLSQASDLLAQNFICVRSFDHDRFDPCELAVKDFVLVVSRGNPDAFICTKSYADSHCKDSKKEFTHALGQKGESVCVLNFNQPETGNYCAAQPDFFKYAADPYGL